MAIIYILISTELSKRLDLSQTHDKGHFFLKESWKENQRIVKRYLGRQSQTKGSGEATGTAHSYPGEPGEHLVISMKSQLPSDSFQGPQVDSLTPQQCQINFQTLPHFHLPMFQSTLSY